MTPTPQEMPRDWIVSKVGEVCTIDNQLREPISEQERKGMQGPYPYYGPTKAVDFLDHYRVEGRYALIGEDGDHFLKYNTQDMTQLVAGQFNVNNHAHLVRGNGLCTTEWFYTYFRRRRLTPYLTRQGAGRYKLNKAALESIPIETPPIAEQLEIFRIVQNWDRAIDLTERLMAENQLRRKGLMQQLLTGKRRLPGFKGEWREFAIGKLFKEVNRPVEWDDEELYDLISVRRRSGGLFHRESLYGKQILTKNLKTARTGDFLISKMQVLHGATGLVTSEFDGMKISGSYISLVPREPAKVSAEFFSFFSQLPSFYHLTFLASFGVHIEKMTFNVKWFMQSMVLIPPTLEEQAAIVTFLKSMDREVELLQAKVAALREQKKGLMQQLLTGKVRVKLNN